MLDRHILRLWICERAGRVAIAPGIIAMETSNLEFKLLGMRWPFSLVTTDKLPYVAGLELKRA